MTKAERETIKVLLTHLRKPIMEVFRVAQATVALEELLRLDAAARAREKRG
jgi:hypothetical protein